MPNRVHNRRRKPEGWKKAKRVLWTERAKAARRGTPSAQEGEEVRHRFMGRSNKDKAKYLSVFERDDDDDDDDDGSDSFGVARGGGKRRRRKRRTSKKKKSKTTRRKASKRASRKRRRTRRR